MSFFDCEIPVNVPGSTGRVTLLDKNTQVFGYMRGGLAQGQDRAWLLSATAYTPNHVQVPLNSPIADELGRAGTPLNVDNHWIQILSAAAAYSLISSGPNVAASALSSSNGNNYGYTLIGASGPIQNVGQNAFQREMNLYPTGAAPQGKIVYLFVAHPLDFSRVYKLEAVR
jgi:type IV secretion system protein VirB10